MLDPRRDCPAELRLRGLSLRVEPMHGPAGPGASAGALAQDVAAGAAMVGQLPDAALLELAASAERAAAQAVSARMVALAELSRRYEAEEVGEFAPDEVAFRMRWGIRAASARVHEATMLVDRLPATFALVAEGRLDEQRARTVVAGTDTLPAGAAAAVDAAIAPVAPELTNWQLRDRVAAEVAAVDAARHAAGRRERRVAPNPLPDGLAELIITGPAPEIATIFTALDGLAHGRPPAGDGTGIDAARFDALADWAQAVLDGAAGGPPVPGTGRWAGSRPHLLLTMSADTLAGTGDHPALLGGYGYLPAPVARDLAAEAGRCDRLLTDPAGGAVVGVASQTTPGPARRDRGAERGLPWPPREVITWPGEPSEGAAPQACPATGRRHAPGAGRYRPRLALDRLVRLRYQRCTAPGCSRPADRCDLDHAIGWPTGPTCPCNLHPLCRRHHRMKHAGGTAVEILADGTVRWTTRTGHTYTTVPPPALHVPTARAAPVLTAAHGAGGARAQQSADAPSHARPRRPVGRGPAARRVLRGRDPGAGREPGLRGGPVGQRRGRRRGPRPDLPGGRRRPGQHERHHRAAGPARLRRGGRCGRGGARPRAGDRRGRGDRAGRRRVPSRRGVRPACLTSRPGDNPPTGRPARIIVGSRRGRLPLIT